ncbi:hypothetical protein Sme01_35690 [Sphaerisporangium melleum]|uniref:Uncharacterized protein n=1 Tax=Sphaerisporangium melleum TaxID=321316 RepID=A0A917R9N5_9ACTN|nr:hypothetical protein GCM10007964_44340 [Sphaerisporangium melleum]GII71093.1 hypothetical protein Sme01_35690 [Sphaerisporangium melleum]
MTASLPKAAHRPRKGTPHERAAIAGGHVMSTQEPPTSGESRTALNEDWAATIVGLVLLVLVITGVIPTGLVP